MGRFRRGDLVLNSDQKLKIDSAEVSDNGTQLEVNKSVKAESIELASGPAITNITNSSSSDSTSELMTSQAVQEYITNATAGFSTGTDAVGSIIQPRPEILSSQLFYGANGAELDPNFDHWNQTIFNDDVVNSGGLSVGASLTSGLFASIIEARASGGGYSIRYYDEAGTLQYSTRALTHIVSTASTLYYPILGILKSGGCYFGVDWHTSSNKKYLVAVNSDCSGVIEHYFGENSYTHQFGSLPNDDILILRDETPTKLAIYRPDFDSSTFIVIQDFTEVTGGLTGLGYGGANIKYLGNNKIVCTRYTGAVNSLSIIDISTNTYIASNGISGGSGSLYFDILPDKSMCLVVIKGNPDYTVFVRFFDENLNALTDTIEFTDIDYVQGACYPCVLPDGNHFILFYYATYPNTGWLVIDRLGNLVDSGFSAFTGLTGPSLLGAYLTPNGKYYVHAYDDNGPRHIILDIPLKVSQLDGGGTIIDGVSSDPYERSSTKLLDTTAINGKFSNDGINLTQNLKPFMVGDRSVGVDFKDTYVPALTQYLIPDSLSIVNLSAIGLDNGNLAIFYVSGSSTTKKVSIVNPNNAEILATTQFANASGITSATPIRKALMLNSGYIVSAYRETGSGGSLVAIDQAGTEVAFPYNTGASHSIQCIERLPNDEILVFSYTNIGANGETGRFKLDIDSSSFIQIDSWNPNNSYAQTPTTLYYMEDGKILFFGSSTLYVADLEGNLLNSRNISSEMSNGRVHYNKVTGLVHIIGYYTAGYGETALIANYTKDLEFFGYTVLDVERAATPYFYENSIHLPNGDFVFGFRSKVDGNTTCIIKPNGQVIRLKDESSTIIFYSNYGQYCALPNGRDFMLLSVYSNKIQGTFYSRDEIEKPAQKHKLILDYANSGTNDFKIIGYERKSIYAGTDNETAKVVSVAPFRSGKYAVIYTDSTLNRPVISIYDRDDNLTVDKKTIFLGYDMSPTGVVSLPYYPSVDSFIHNDWIAMIFKNETSNETVVVVCDENGEQPCYPLEFLYGGTIKVLDNDDILVLSYDSSPYQYTQQSSGYYPQTWRVDTDSSSFIQIVSPLRSTYYLSGVPTQISKNRMITYSYGWRSVGVRNFGTASGTGLFYSGGKSLLGYNPVAVTPGNRIVAIERSGSYGSYVYKPYIWQYNPDDESFEFIGEGDSVTKFYNTSSALSTPIVSNDGNIIIGGGIAATYEYGIHIFNSDGKLLNPNGPFATAPGGYIPEYMYLFKGFDGTIYSTNHRSGGANMLVDKWLPIIRKESPLKYTYDVRDSYDQTAYITVLTTDQSDKLISHDDASGLSMTVPSNSNDPLPIGYRCSFVQVSSGAITFVEDGGVTITSPDSNLTTNGAGSLAEIVKIDTNTWLLTGDLT